jgi:tetratricopeptide (TPR) repeat protein
LLSGEPNSLRTKVGSEALANVRESYAAQFGWLQEVRKANKDIRQGKLPEAVSAYRQLVADRPNDAQCWYTLAMLYAMQAKWKSSTESAKRVVEITPENANGHRALIRALANQKEYDSALTAAEKVLELPDAQVDDWYTLALLSRATGDDSRYRGCCEGLVTRFGDADDPDTLNTMVWICCLGPKPLADVEPVLQRARDAIQGGQATHPLLNTLGAILLRAENIPEARQRLKEAVESHEKDGTAWDHMFLAMAAQRDNQPDEYRKWLQEAKSWAATNLTQMSAADPLDGWRIQLEFEILFREAEQLAEGSE